MGRVVSFLKKVGVFEISSSKKIMSENVEDIPAKLQRFYVFNSSWGPREGEEDKKIVYFYPEDEEHKSKHVGLIEGLVKFMSVFSETPAKTQHSQKAKTVFLEVEPEFWIVLNVALPHRIKTKSDGTRDINYYSDKLHDNVLEAILQRTYDMFKIFTGGFSNYDNETIKVKSAAFFSRYIQTLNFGTNHLTSDLFGAVQFLTLEPLDFLHVLSFVNKIESDFGCIDKSLFLHHGNIVWSGIQQKETQLLFNYVYHTLLLQNATKSTGSLNNSPFSGHQGRFLTGPPNIIKLTADDVNSLRIPKVFLPIFIEETNEYTLKEYHFLVYYAIKSTLCLLIPIEVDFTVDFFKRLDGHLGPRLTNMSADLLDVFGRSSSVISTGTSSDPSILSPTLCINPSTNDGNSSNLSEDSVNLVYFNEANKAMKDTTPNANIKLSVQDIEIQHGITDLNEDLKDILGMDDKITSKMTTELTVKLATDDWIVGKKIDQRQLYLAFKGKGSSNLLDINAEVDKIMASEFKNICLP